MPQSLSNIVVHSTFSTKNREPWLDSDICSRMHAYLATICRDAGGNALRIGGISDHVHILSTLPRTISQSKMIEQLKTTSSKWIKTVDVRFRNFSWQRGYAAFSVSPSQTETVVKYIDRQKDHHRARTFQEEYLELLRKHGIRFDERFVWD
jgi:putative transposase